MSFVSKPLHYNYQLNGFRGLCCGMVFLYHVFGIFPLDHYGDWYNAIVSCFRYGVEMFFMVSGYVIVGSLKRSPSISQFLLERFIRIYAVWGPVFLFIVVLTHHNGIGIWGEGDAVFNIVANLLLLPPFVQVPWVNAVSWSLTYEWVFYFAAALRLTLTNRVWTVLWSVLVAVFIGCFPRSLFFLTGVVVAVYPTWFRRRLHWFQYGGISGLGFIVLWRLTGANKAEFTETFIDWIQDGRILPAVLAFLCSVHMFTTVVMTNSYAFLRGKGFQTLGDISFSLYLWQAPVLAAIKRGGFRFLPGSEEWVLMAIIGVIALLVLIPVSRASRQSLEIRLSKELRNSLSRTSLPPVSKNSTVYKRDSVPQ